MRDKTYSGGINDHNNYNNENIAVLEDFDLYNKCYHIVNIYDMGKLL